MPGPATFWSRFLRENWLYVAIPIGAVLVALAWLVLFSDESSSGVLYTIR